MSSSFNNTRAAEPRIQFNFWGEDHDIQVSGNQYFPQARWREAILYYLMGIWGNKQVVTYRPKIIFGDVTLRLDAKDGMYYAYGTSSEALGFDLILLDGDEKLEVGCRQEEVEIALIRFVKNNRIQALTIRLELGTIVLWKKPRRSQYGIEANRIPRSWGVRGPEW